MFIEIEAADNVGQSISEAGSCKANSTRQGGVVYHEKHILEVPKIHIRTLYNG